MKEKIRFSENPWSYNSNAVLIAHLFNINGKRELLIQLSEKLKFPDYFGFNWDALDECLRDFHWIKEGKIVLVHDDLPTLSEREWRIYLDVLISSVQDWKEGEEHSFEVVFPESARDQVLQYISDVSTYD